MARNFIRIQAPKDGIPLTVIRRRRDRELYDLLLATHQNYIAKLEEVTLLWPTIYPGVLTQGFGIHPEWYKQFKLPGHEGLDMKAPLETEIVNVHGGTVVRVDKDEQHLAYGWHIRVEFTGVDGWKYECTYAHFAHPSELEVGMEVYAGQVLGYAGSTGNSTGPHLHLMLKQEEEGPLAKSYAAEGWPTAANGFTIIDPTEFFEELR